MTGDDTLPRRSARRAVDWLVGVRELHRLRRFEIAFTTAFLIYMARNALDASEWLTTAGFHPSASTVRPGKPVFPPLPVWGAVLFLTALFGAGLLRLVTPAFRRGCFVVLFLCAVYAQGVDPYSAFALNKIYIAGFLLLALSPPVEPATFRGSLVTMRVFQATLLTIYFFTGYTKIAHGDWLAHSDVLWTQAQGFYRTDLAAWMLRTLPKPAWAVMQGSVLAFELGAPLWFCWRRTRPFAIAYGLCFHLGIALMMKAVWVFSLQMVTFYVLFVEPSTSARLKKFFEGLFGYENGSR